MRWPFSMASFHSLDKISLKRKDRPQLLLYLSGHTPSNPSFFYYTRLGVCHRHMVWPYCTQINRPNKRLSTHEFPTPPICLIQQSAKMSSRIDRNRWFFCRGAYFWRKSVMFFSRVCLYKARCRQTHTSLKNTRRLQRTLHGNEQNRRTAAA